MNKLVLLAILLHLQLQTMAQNYIEQIDPKTDEKILVGTINDSLLKAYNYIWYKEGINSYNVDTILIKSLKAQLPNYTFTVFAGTWCEDTQHLLPQFMSVLQKANGQNLLTLIGVDRTKKALNNEELLMDISHVPTVIIKKGHREIGRIVETITKKTIEQELLYLIEKDKANWK